MASSEGSAGDFDGRWACVVSTHPFHSMNGPRKGKTAAFYGTVLCVLPPGAPLRRGGVYLQSFLLSSRGCDCKVLPLAKGEHTCECEQSSVNRRVRAKVRWLHSARRAHAHRTSARIGAGDRHRVLVCRAGVSVSGAVPSSAARRQPMLEQLEAAAAHGIEATHFAARGKRWVRAAGTVSGVPFAAG